jgi:hypothetical protein
MSDKGKNKGEWSEMYIFYRSSQMRAVQTSLQYGVHIK